MLRRTNFQSLKLRDYVGTAFANKESGLVPHINPEVLATKASSSNRRFSTIAVAFCSTGQASVFSAGGRMTALPLSLPDSPSLHPGPKAKTETKAKAIQSGQSLLTLDRVLVRSCLPQRTQATCSPSGSKCRFSNFCASQAAAGPVALSYGL